MGYLGNPRMVLMGQDSMPIANYEYPADPTATSNPTRVPVSWLNTLTGTIWTCIDNTTDANIWKSQGPIVVEEESFTPDFSAGSVTNFTFTGTKSRVGRFLHLDIYGIATGVPSGSFIFTLPDSLTADVSTIVLSSEADYFGGGALRDASPATSYPLRGIHVTSDATQVRILAFSSSATLGTLSNSSPITMASGDHIALRLAVPIDGWTVNTIS